MLIVSVTGPIGVGKSAVLNELKKLTALQHACTWMYYLEPVEEWQNEGWLADFHKEPARTALGFQIKVLIGQAAEMRRWTAVGQNGGSELVIITERSPVDGCEIFMPLSPTLDREKDLVKAFGAQLWRPHLNVLLNCSMETARTRRESRNRNEPENAYAETVHKTYTEKVSLVDCVVENEGPAEETAAKVLAKITEMLNR